MRKKLFLIVLALALCITGSMLAVGCKTPEYTVTFAAESGETITTKTVLEGETVSAEGVEATEKVGYTVVWTVDGAAYDFATPVNGDLTITASYEANTNTAYKTEYYVEKVNGGYELSETVNGTGVTGAEVTAEKKTFEGMEYTLTSDSVEKTTINGDGSTVLKVYYNRVKYNVVFKANGEEFSDNKVKYGGTVRKPAKNPDVIEVDKATYKTFKHWSLTEGGEEFNFTTKITANTTLFAVYEENYYEYALNLTANTALYEIKVGGETYDAAKTYRFGDKVELTFVFTDEAVGTPVVKANGETVEANNGVYTVTVGGDTEITVEGVNGREYTVVGSVVMAEMYGAPEWVETPAYEDIIIKVGESYFTNCVGETGAFSVAGLVSGEQSIEFVVADGEGYKTVSNGATKVTLNRTTADETDVYTIAEAVTVTPTAFTMSNASYSFADGKIKNVAMQGNNKDNVDFKYDGFKPGNKDFAVTMTYDQEIGGNKSTESEPTIGIKLYDAEGNSVLLAWRNSGWLRFRVNDSGDYFEAADQRLIMGAGGLLGKSEWPDCYRLVTLTYVKSGDWMHVFFSGNAKGDNQRAVEFNDLLLCSIDLATGTVYTKEKMEGNGSALKGTGTWFVYNFSDALGVLNNIDRVDTVLWMSAAFYGEVYGLGYTYDADVIASYEAKTKTEFKVTADEGATVTYSDAFVDANGGKTLSVLGYEFEQNITVQIAEGYVIDTFTINGEACTESPDAEGKITIPYAKVSSREGRIEMVIKTIKGTYTTISGKVDTTAVSAFSVLPAATVVLENDDRSYELAVINGEFTGKVLGGNYDIYVKESSYYTSTKLENKSTADKDIVITLKERTLGGSVTIGDQTFYSGGKTGNVEANKAAITSPVAHGYTVEDVDGKEVTSSVATTPERQVMLFSGFSAEQFVVRATYTYKDVSDRYNVFGFYLIDGAGQIGHLGVYGSGTSTMRTICSDTGAWKSFPGNHTVIRTMTGKEEEWYNGGFSIEYAMVYDKGNIHFLVNCETVYGPGWECVYSGRIPTWGTVFDGTNVTEWGTALSGPVAVGLVDTQNRGGGAALWSWSNYSVVAGAEAIDGFMAKSVKLSDSAAAVATADFGGSAEIDWDTEEYKIVKLAPKTSGDKIVDVKVNGVSSKYAMYDTTTGKVDLYLPFMVDTKEMVIDVTVSKNMADYAHEAEVNELKDNGDGTYVSGNKNSKPQETAMKNNGAAVTFTPATQKLTFTYATTWTGMKNMDGYDFQAGMFVRSAEGGMLRMGFTRAGDVLRMRTANVRLSGNYVSATNANPWDALGKASGYHSTEHGASKLYIRVTIDGYNWKIESMTGGSCACKKDWCLVREFSVYDDYNNDLPCTSFNKDSTGSATYDAGIVNKMFVNDLYSLDLPCTFGLSVINEQGNTKIVTFTDVSYEITNK